MIETQRVLDYCAAKPGVTSDFPFDDNVLVFRVMGKMYALHGMKQSDRINLKCDPPYAEILREQFPEIVLPGYHMSKKHWNTVIYNTGLSWDNLQRWIDHSYDMIVEKLAKAQRQQLGYKT